MINTLVAKVECVYLAIFWHRILGWCSLFKVLTLILPVWVYDESIWLPLDGDRESEEETARVGKRQRCQFISKRWQDKGCGNPTPLCAAQGLIKYSIIFKLKWRIRGKSAGRPGWLKKVTLLFLINIGQYH